MKNSRFALQYFYFPTFTSHRRFLTAPALAPEYRNQYLINPHPLSMRMSDILFSSVEKYHGGRPWGRFLDAGTGVHSLKWIQTLQTDSWSAITCDNYMKGQIEKESGIIVRPQDKVLVGDWMDDKFCESLGTFDTILADYLIGAVDGFSPYEQDTIIKK